MCLQPQTKIITHSLFLVILLGTSSKETHVEPFRYTKEPAGFRASCSRMRERTQYLSAGGPTPSLPPDHPGCKSVTVPPGTWRPSCRGTAPRSTRPQRPPPCPWPETRSPHRGHYPGSPAGGGRDTHKYLDNENRLIRSLDNNRVSWDRLCCDR